MDTSNGILSCVSEWHYRKPQDQPRQTYDFTCCFT